jgi:hypothetical protein
MHGDDLQVHGSGFRSNHAQKEAGVVRRRRKGILGWRLVKRRQPVLGVGDDLAQNYLHPRVLHEPQGDSKPYDPRPKPSGFVFR